jgi:hypothetical protein
MHHGSSINVVIVILKDLQSKLPIDKITAHKISPGLGFGGYVKRFNGRSGMCGLPIVASSISTLLIVSGILKNISSYRSAVSNS